MAQVLQHMFIRFLCALLLFNMGILHGKQKFGYASFSQKYNLTELHCFSNQGAAPCSRDIFALQKSMFIKLAEYDNSSYPPWFPHIPYLATFIHSRILTPKIGRWWPERCPGAPRRRRGPSARPRTSTRNPWKRVWFDTDVAPFLKNNINPNSPPKSWVCIS